MPVRSGLDMSTHGTAVERPTRSDCRRPCKQIVLDVKPLTLDIDCLAQLDQLEAGSEELKLTPVFGIYNQSLARSELNYGSRPVSFFPDFQSGRDS